MRISSFQGLEERLRLLFLAADDLEGQLEDLLIVPQSAQDLADGLAAQAELLGDLGDGPLGEEVQDTLGIPLDGLKVKRVDRVFAYRSCLCISYFKIVI